MRDNRLIKIVPPLDGIINEINDSLEKMKRFDKKLGSRIAQIEKGIKALDEKMKRIEKYAK
jgi:prefoldin subunit 5